MNNHEDQFSQPDPLLNFYKYSCVDMSRLEHSRCIFTHNELYFCEAKKFNDPFECKFRLALGGSQEEQMIYWDHVLGMIDSSLNEEASSSIILKDKELLTSPGFIKGLEDKANQVVREQWGICCLSKVKDNILMWSHYANKHQGFCLKFSIEQNDALFGIELMRKKPPQEQKKAAPLEVKYSKDYPFAKRLQEDLLEKTIFTKAKQWAYEKEWRMIIMDGVGSWHFPPQFLTGVIFGCSMSEEHKELIRGWCKNRETPIKYYQARQSKKEYRIHIDEIP